MYAHKVDSYLILLIFQLDPQDDPIRRDLEITLEQVLTGCTKKLDITRNIFFSATSDPRQEVKSIEISLPAGVLEGHECPYEKLGDKHPGRTPGDIIFVVRYRKHPCFELAGFDLKYCALITESEARDGVQMEIPTIEPDGKPLNFYTKKGFRQDTVRTFDNYGLPFPGDEHKRGKLIVSFAIVNDDTKGEWLP